MFLPFINRFIHINLCVSSFKSSFNTIWSTLRTLIKFTGKFIYFTCYCICFTCKLIYVTCKLIFVTVNQGCIFCRYSQPPPLLFLKIFGNSLFRASISLYMIGEDFQKGFGKFFKIFGRIYTPHSRIRENI